MKENPKEYKYRVRVLPGVWTVGLCTWGQVKAHFSPNAIEPDGLEWEDLYWAPLWER